MKIGLIGDFNQDVTAHQAIPMAIELAAKDQFKDIEVQWIRTTEILVTDLRQYAGLWCVPASPYADMEKVLQAIRFARTKNVPFLGTCGGYQHAALEFARNALGFSHADNAEVNPATDMPLISSLVCKLIEVSGGISLQANSRVAGIYGQNTVSEEYRCGFGVNRDYLNLFDDSSMKFTGFDSEGDPRVLEIPANRFFLGTAFQPERSALRGESHPIIKSFLEAAAKTSIDFAD